MHGSAGFRHRQSRPVGMPLSPVGRPGSFHCRSIPIDLRRRIRFQSRINSLSRAPTRSRVQGVAVARFAEVRVDGRPRRSLERLGPTPMSSGSFGGRAYRSTRSHLFAGFQSPGVVDRWPWRAAIHVQSRPTFRHRALRDPLVACPEGRGRSSSGPGNTRREKPAAEHASAENTRRGYRCEPSMLARPAGWLSRTRTRDLSGIPGRSTRKGGSQGLSLPTTRSEVCIPSPWIRLGICRANLFV